MVGPFLDDRGSFTRRVVKPLQEKEETIYVVSGTDAEDYVEKWFKSKRVKHAGNGLRPATISGFSDGLKLLFQRGQLKGLDATYHFTFTGSECFEPPVDIRDQTLQVT